MLTTLLFESPIWIIIPLALIAAILGWRYFQLRRRSDKLAILIAVGIAATVGITAALVVTDREQIQASWSRLVQAADKRDTAAAMAEISPGFSSGGLNRQSLGRLAEQAAKRLNGARINFYLFEIHEIADDTARATVWAHYTASGNSAGLRGQAIPTQWSIAYRRDDDDRWRISGARSIQPTNINLQWALRQ